MRKQQKEFFMKNFTRLAVFFISNYLISPRLFNKTILISEHFTSLKENSSNNEWGKWFYFFNEGAKMKISV
jgi:hypothetical protein